ncbi:MAG: hypothetical protein JXR51_14910 [Bacteroidales bacterium]|nr:hypothetical protein [Bacteroidales bacterium]MBN2758461.1 hypothetical protein [Bacteroidales bacterium]
MKTRPLIKAGFVGLILIISSLFMMQTFPKKAVYMSEGFVTPIIYFEFVESPIEVYDFFGISSETSANEDFIAKMDYGNKLDFGFAFIYSFFLVFLFWSIFKLSNNKVYIIAIILAVFAFVFDVLENVQLLSITSKLNSGDFSSEIINLQIFTWIKWGSLALIFLIFAYWIYFNRAAKYVAIISVLPFILGVLAFIDKGLMTEIFAKSISAMFAISVFYTFFYKKLKLDNKNKTS